MLAHGCPGGMSLAGGWIAAVDLVQWSVPDFGYPRSAEVALGIGKMGGEVCGRCR